MKTKIAFTRLVNKVAKDMDADTDYHEVIAIAMSYEATKEEAERVAKELGRRPPPKPKARRLTETQRRVAAAILGVSNAGSDHLFRGPHANFDEMNIRQLIGRNPSMRAAVLYFVQGLCETEEMADMFEVEARSWYLKMRHETIEHLSLVHHRYAHLFAAMGE
jgi:hypothetical protein